ncbi:hypothetical protein E2C01_086173 [Portunus trituberculatus]|uniref:Uncharacterized protein n=1 Tax=Portunus trituberculatus TaxID=210409 RepID=A0A5B7JFM6_PORTR|nr:hypothetical protein [Portunus trituberculatus]
MLLFLLLFHLLI